MVTVDQTGAGGSTSKIYVNGVAETTTGPTDTGAAASVFPATAPEARPLIGAQEKETNLQKFMGYVDEIQFSKGTTPAAVRSADWAKLSYETQKAGATALTLGSTVALTVSAPTAISYTVDSAVYYTGTAIAPNLAVVTNGADSFTVNTALPAGLSLNVKTGAISGTPSAASALASYTVTAYNSAGSTTKGIKIRVIAATAPDAPTGVTVMQNGPTSAAITWMAPAFNGGSAITGYKAMAVSDTAKSCTTNGALTCVISGLVPAQTYTFVAKATNAIGTSVASAPSLSVTVSLKPRSLLIPVSGSARPYTFVLSPELLASTGKVTMAITDVWGRTVWSRSVAPAAEQIRELTWNGKASNGSAVSAGVYVVRVSVREGGKTTDAFEKTITLKPR